MSSTRLWWAVRLIAVPGGRTDPNHPNAFHGVPAAQMGRYAENANIEQCADRGVVRRPKCRRWTEPPENGDSFCSRSHQNGHANAKVDHERPSSCRSAHNIQADWRRIEYERPLPESPATHPTTLSGLGTRSLAAWRATALRDFTARSNCLCAASIRWISAFVSGARQIPFT